MLVQKIDGALVPWNGEEINGTQNPPNIEQLWSDEELAAVGLYRVTNGDVPDGKIATEWTLTDTPNGPMNVPTLVDIPAPMPTLEDRVAAIEKKLGL